MSCSKTRSYQGSYTTELGFYQFLRDVDEGTTQCAQGVPWPARPACAPRPQLQVQTMGPSTSREKLEYYRMQRSRIRRVMQDLDRRTDHERAQQGTRALGAEQPVMPLEYYNPRGDT